MFNVGEYVKTKDGVGKIVEMYKSHKTNEYVLYKVDVSGVCELYHRRDLDYYNPYKVGDKVKVVRELDNLNFWSTNMKTALGKVYVVTETNKKGVFLEIDEIVYHFHALEVEPYIDYEFKKGDRVKVTGEHPLLYPMWNPEGKMDNTIGEIGEVIYTGKNSITGSNYVRVKFENTDSWAYNSAEVELVESIKLYELFKIYDNSKNSDRVFRDSDGYEYYYNKASGTIQRRCGVATTSELTRALYTDDIMRIEVYEV